MSTIFLSYRRDDTSGYAFALRDRLAERFGPEEVFLDSEIKAGADFVEVIRREMSICRVVIVLIGRQWSNCTDEHGHRRLDSPSDFVRLEVKLALERDLCVIPLTVDGARMPVVGELPEDLGPLSHRLALKVTNEGFRQDVSRLIEAIENGIEVRPGEVQPQLSEIVVGDERVLDHGQEVRAVAFSRDGEILASGGGPRTVFSPDAAQIILWRMSDGTQIRKLIGHDAPAARMAFSPRGDILASCGHSSTRIWRISDGLCLHNLTKGLLWNTFSFGWNDLSFSKDGSLLSCWYDDDSAGFWPWEGAKGHDLWSVEDGRYLGKKTTTESFRKGEFYLRNSSPDGITVAARERASDGRCSTDEIVLKARTTGALIRRLPGKFQTQPAFSGDGRLLACSVSYDRAVLLWRVADGTLVKRLEWPVGRAFFNAASGVALSPNGKWLAAATPDHLIHLWPVRSTPSSEKGR
jgi:WD40 repeat protein